jgi:plasmid maintenance system killer protein
LSADVNVEPFEIKLGFRELEFFTNLNKNLQDFLLILNDDKDDIDMRSMTSTTFEVDIDKKLR